MICDSSYAEHPALYDTLRRVAQALHPHSYLEIGVREGDSLSTVLEVCDPAWLILCDNWLSDYGGSNRHDHVHIWSVLAKAEYKGNVVFLDGASQEKLSDWEDYIGWTMAIDLILVDGDHSLEGAKRDFDLCWTLLRAGGVMLADDTTHRFHPYLSKAFKDFVQAKGGEYLFEHCDQNSGVAGARKR